MPIGRNGAALDRLVAELQEPAARLSGEEWSADREWCAQRLEELLARAQLRAWIIESGDDGSSVLTAQCPLGEGRALLACARPPISDPRAGAFLVARSLPFGARRYLLVGRPLIVAGAGASRLSALIGSLRAPRGEFWHVHGAVVARAARSLLAESESRAAESYAA